MRFVIEVSYNHIATFPVVGQKVGQCLEFRELFDVAVARAVAEMRILGIAKIQLILFDYIYNVLVNFGPVLET